MTRISLLLLALVVPAAYGFGVVVSPSTARSVRASPLSVVEENMDGPGFAFNEPGFEDDADDEEMMDTTVASSTPTSSFTTPQFKFDNEEAISKAKDTFADLTAKAKDFADDEKVQEIAGKAKDFAKDVMGQLFGAVGNKLKEIKKEKEQSKAGASSTTTTTTASATDFDGSMD